jgi:hypothetical protein
VGRFPRVHARTRRSDFPAPPLRSLSLCSAVPRLIAAMASGSPRFLGNPFVRALLSDPDEATVPGHSGDALLLDTAVLPSVVSTTSALVTPPFRGSITRPARSLSTLRSRRRRRPRKTRFRLVANLGRAGLTPAGFHREVSASITSSLPPHPGFSWRTETRRFRESASNPGDQITVKVAVTDEGLAAYSWREAGLRGGIRARSHVHEVPCHLPLHRCCERVSVHRRNGVRDRPHQARLQRDSGVIDASVLSSFDDDGRPVRLGEYRRQRWRGSERPIIDAWLKRPSLIGRASWRAPNGMGSKLRRC